MSLVAAPWSLQHKSSRSLRCCDKVFANAPLAVLSAFPLTVRTVGTAATPPSDHYPVRLVCSATQRVRRSTLPRYIASHPEWQPCLMHYISKE
eukprot:4183125-Amphidinium_carterae.1